MKILLVTKHPRLEEQSLHERSLDAVKRSLEAQGLAYVCASREALEPELESADLIVTVGGDGTVLETSHYVVHQPILGVNSNPVTSVGSLCVATAESFLGILQDYLSGAIQTQCVARIEIRLNHQLVDYSALNDILVANSNPAALTRYWLDFGEGEVLHKSSGIWISTACGSTGALVSSGGYVQAIEDRRIQWVCREPFFSGENPPLGMHGFLDPGQVLRIRSQMAQGKIYVDGSHRMLSFPEGSTLELTESACDLSLVMTPAMEARRQQIGRWREHYEIERRHESSGVCRAGCL